MKNEERQLGIDIPTLVAVSSLAWILVNVSHEIIGHAGSAALLGIPVRAVSTTTASIEWDQMMSIGALRIIMASGTIMNIMGGLVALILLRLQKQANSAVRFFLWLFATFSFIIVALNLVSVMLIGAGDWTEVIRELEPRGLWKAIIIGAGVLITIFGTIMPLSLWMPDLRGNRKAKLTITVIPVVALIVVQSLSLIGSPFVRLPSGASHLLACVFAYLHFIIWAILVNVFPMPHSKKPVESICLPRSYGWLISGLVFTLFYLVVLGSGIGSA